MKTLLNKTFFICLVCITLLLNINSNIVSATNTYAPILSQGSVLIDGRTGTILYENNCHAKYEPASTTKVMTALIVLENTNLTDKVTIGKDPQSVDGSAMGICEGEVYTVEELLLGLLLSSCNDIAEALAEHITGLTVSTGSNAKFGELMTKKAIELGALNTTFKNPSGLSEEGHLTTAYDLALIMRAASLNEDFVRISQTESHFYENHPFSNGSEKWATNGNKCLFDYQPYYYEHLYSGKTGYTPEANYTYTAASKKGDQYLVASFLNGEDYSQLFNGVGDFFDWGFDNFNTKKIISKDEQLSSVKTSDNVTIPLHSANDIYYTFKNSDNITIDKSVIFNEIDLSKRTINKGEILLNSTLQIDKNTSITVPLYSSVNKVYTPPTSIKNSTAIKLLILIICIAFVVFIFIRSIIKVYLLSKKRKSIRNKYDF